MPERPVPSALILAAVAGLAGAACSEESPCDAEALRSAVEGARAGETVRMGRCRIEAALTVPDGVTLAGADRAASVLVVPEGEIGVRLGAGSALVGLSVESTGAIAVLGRGDGVITLEDVTVTAARGLGLGFDGASEVVMRDVEVLGPITAENAGDVAFLRVRPRSGLMEGEVCDPEQVRECDEGELRDVGCAGCEDLVQSCVCGAWQTVVALYGVGLLGVGRSTLEDVTVQGFASIGLTALGTDADGIVVASALDWTGGAARGNLGTGVFAQGVSTRLDHVELAETLEGASGHLTYGGWLAGEPDAPVHSETSGLSVRGNARYGLILIDVEGSHDELHAEDNGDVGVWIARANEVSLSRAVLARNALAGILVRDSRAVSITESAVSETFEATTGAEGGGQITIGDGIQLWRSVEDLVLDTVALTNNERAGLVIDLEGTNGETIVLRGIVVAGQGDALGVVAGDVDGSALTALDPATWQGEADIQRDATTAANDLAALGADLDFSTAVTPARVPDPTGIVSPCD